MKKKELAGTNSKATIENEGQLIKGLSFFIQSKSNNNLPIMGHTNTKYKDDGKVQAFASMFCLGERKFRCCKCNAYFKVNVDDGYTQCKKAGGIDYIDE